MGGVLCVCFVVGNRDMRNRPRGGRPRPVCVVQFVGIFGVLFVLAPGLSILWWCPHIIPFKSSLRQKRQPRYISAPGYSIPLWPHVESIWIYQPDPPPNTFAWLMPVHVDTNLSRIPRRKIAYPSLPRPNRQHTQQACEQGEQDCSQENGFAGAVFVFHWVQRLTVVIANFSANLQDISIMNLIEMSGYLLHSQLE